MDKNDIYALATRSIHDYTNRDATSIILKEYALMGMCDILSSLDEMDLLGKHTSMFLLPDFTFSRNDLRYKAGFPYGTIIHIDSKNTPYVPLGFRPNCCGITFVKLNSFDETVIEQKLSNVKKEFRDLYSDDLNRGSHFVGIYADDVSGEKYGLLHGSFNSVKSGVNDIPGLYLDKTNYWDPSIRYYSRQGAKFPYLLGDVALEYYQAYIKHELFTKTMRHTLSKFIFNDSKMIFNETHEGFYDVNTIVLGSYVGRTLFSNPVMLNPNTNLAIVQTEKTIQIGTIPLFVCPHGGGYMINDVVGGSYLSNDAYYKVKYPNNAVMKVDDIRKLIYGYRTDVAKVWTEALGFGKIIKELRPVINYKL